MLLLTTSSDKIQLITGADGASIDVHTSYVDNASGTITPLRTNVVGIATATTTEIVPSPSSGTQRNVKGIYISNTSSSVSTQATVTHTDGTNVVDLINVTLLANETLMLNASGTWVHLDQQGAEYDYTANQSVNLGVTGTIAETMPREIITEANNTIGATGTLYLQAIYLKAGQTINNISIYSATTAASGTSNLFFALYDVNRNLVAQSANQGAYTWNSQSQKTLAMTSPYRVPTSGIYYVGLLQVATTIATIKGNVARISGVLGGLTPSVGGASSTGLTTALPNPAAATSSSSTSMYAAVS